MQQKQESPIAPEWNNTSGDPHPNASYAPNYGWLFPTTPREEPKTWIYWMVVCATICILIIILILIYDIFCRCRDTSVQNIFDGGPPASPSHQFSYTIGIKAEEASGAFDTRQAVIKIELLDSWSRYLGTVAVPCYLLKFKQERESSGSARDSSSSANQPARSKSKESSQGSKQSAQTQRQAAKQPLPMQVKQEAIELRHNVEADPHYKSLTDLHEIWSSSTPNSSSLKFQYIRRTPLKSFSFVRVMHDSYGRDAQVKLKYFVVYDNQKREFFRADLQGKVLKAAHPCPPSKWQVFKVEKSAHIDQTNELRAFANSVKRGNQCFPNCC